MARLPLFPLGTVLLPGLPLPLHVFEPRYLHLVRDLLGRPVAERRFGVVAIRTGSEVGAHDATELYSVGCVAELRRARPRADGRFDVLAVGVERFRLVDTTIDDGLAIGEVELLDDVVDVADDELKEAVHQQFASYVQALYRARGQEMTEQPTLPAAPAATSYAVAGAALLSNADRQRLLAAETVGARLELALAMLRRETVLVEKSGTRTGVELSDGPIHPN